MFYSLVNNFTTREDYFMPNEALAMANKYGISFVKNSYVEVSSWKQLNVEQMKMYEDVSALSIEVGEEGSVVYIQLNHSDGRSEIASVSKLKTIEYRIYRKLREKLRTYISKNDNTRRKITIGRFRDEIKDLVRESLPLESQEVALANPISYYVNIANKAFDFADNYPAQRGYVHTAYITFQSIVVYADAHNMDVKPHMFAQNNIDILLDKPFTAYKNCQLFN